MSRSRDASKSSLRRAFLERRRRQPAWLNHWRSRRIAEKVRRLSPFTRGRIVFAYLPVRGEADPGGAIAAALSAGKLLALPRVARRRLEFFSVSGLDGLVRGPFGIPEPVPAPGRRVSFARADLILVPGIAFALSGHRLGYGGGFYDSVLGLRRGAAIGLSFEFQLTARLPVGPHDKLVDGVVTEKRLLLFGERAG